jgi:hypothetical protein
MNPNLSFVRALLIQNRLRKDSFLRNVSFEIQLYIYDYFINEL